MAEMTMPERLIRAIMFAPNEVLDRYQAELALIRVLAVLAEPTMKVRIAAGDLGAGLGLTESQVLTLWSNMLKAVSRPQRWDRP